MSGTKGRPKKVVTGPRRDPLASLKVADIISSKPVIPAEIIARIVDYLAIPDLLRFARVSRRMQEMVYDDARWIKRLKKMGCWDDIEARRHAEGRRPSTQGTQRRTSTIDRSLVNGKGRPEILFTSEDSPSYAQRRKPSVLTPMNRAPAVSDGFDMVQLMSPSKTTFEDSTSALTVLKRIRSIRGNARQEFGRAYGAIGKFYVGAIASNDPMSSLIFTTYSAPDQQAQMLAQVRILSYADFSPGETSRQEKLSQLIETFATRALLEFRKGYEYKDISGRMRQYAHVMHTLNGGDSAVELYLHDNLMIVQKANLGSVSDCVDYSLGYGQLSLERVQSYYERLAGAFSQEVGVVQTVFPNADEVMMLLLEVTAKEVLEPFLTSLFTEASSRGVSIYLRMVSGTFAATQHFVKDIALSREAGDEAISRANAIVSRIYDPHLHSYLEQEIGSFQQKANSEIDRWDNALSEQAASAESFFMSNVNRQADKKDFMSSFKKVVMMPVNILPSFSVSSSTKPVAKSLVNGDGNLTNVPSRSSTPNPLGQKRVATPSLPLEAPSTELAAKAALMNSKLENIRSLFSIEVALNLVHAAKSSLERIAQFIELGGAIGDSARLQCSSIFILLLQTVGVRHVKAGFDKAIDHLSNYNPREDDSSGRDTSSSQVVPLATFLELVNVGDLIQQMLDVFYESELVRLQVSKRDDFLDVNVKEKKKFEAMLDERVAAGLGKGIDVLMDEVEYLCATTQQPTDFNPGNDVVDIGPTNTARLVIEVVGGHTGMLNGATDKTLLDVFSAEVGLRLFAAICKHIKRQRISTSGALPLLSDLSAYAAYIAGFRNNDLNSYFTALREVAQIYLIEGKTDKDVNEMATIISDTDRYRGVFTVEEVVEFAERRSDWLVVKSRVEGRIKGESCSLM